MTPVTILELPKDIIIHNIGTMLNSASILALKPVSKLFATYTDAILKNIWINLMKKAPQGVIDLGNWMARVSHLENPLDRFKALALRFSLNGIALKARIPITPIAYECLQKHAQNIQDESLCKVWSKLCKDIPALPQHDVADSIRRWLLNPANTAQLNGIRSLSLSNLGLTVLPPEILPALKGLRWLDLSKNSLQTLPDEFGSLTELQGLSLANNELKELPEAFGALTKLMRLELQNNKLSALPDSFAGFSAMLRLELSNNRLSVLPGTFAAMVNLQKLDLSSNKFIVLPDSIKSLINLKILCLSNNELNVRRSEFSALTKLIEIDLSNNRLSWKFVAVEL